MSNRYHRYSKRELLGSLHVDYVMSVTDLGLTPKTNRWDVLRAFLNVGEARAERLVEETGGFPRAPECSGAPQHRSDLRLRRAAPSLLLASLRAEGGHAKW